MCIFNRGLYSMDIDTMATRVCSGLQRKKPKNVLYDYMSVKSFTSYILLQKQKFNKNTPLKIILATQLPYTNWKSNELLTNKLSSTILSRCAWKCGRIETYWHSRAYRIVLCFVPIMVARLDCGDRRNTYCFRNGVKKNEQQIVNTMTRVVRCYYTCAIFTVSVRRRIDKTTTVGNISSLTDFGVIVVIPDPSLKRTGITSDMYKYGI
jgi:hypothetical protein